MAKSVHDPEFSEFGFGYTATNGLTYFRSGTLSPWPTLGILSRRFASHPFWDEKGIQFRLEQVGLTPAETEAIVDENGAPFIPTQHLENKFPVDVALRSNGIFYFLQFKRSWCVSKKGNLTEVKKGKFKDFKLPFYRVYFYGNARKPGKGDRAQRENLEKLETSLDDIPSALVRYAVPAFHTLAELSEVYQKGLESLIAGRSSIMCFKASAFSLPGTGMHHISYDTNGTGWRFSEETEKAPNIRPLISEINEIVSDATPLAKTMGELCKTLDKLALKMGLKERPAQMDNDALLRMFGLAAKKPEDKRQAGDEPPGIAFLRTSIVSQDRKAELANGIRKLLEYPFEEEETYPYDLPSRMEFLENFFGADYRCQQILGQPLLVGISHT